MQGLGSIAAVKVLVHRHVQYQAFPKRHSTAINRNGKHAEGKAVTGCLLMHA
jgi:hypothetical protein